MSSVAESPDGMAIQSHYSLRWNNHQAHILRAFEALLHAENLVDVTLVCSETSLRAHKVVLSACSPFFERIFAEHPCKHPVIVLKDFPAHEVAALIDFMYRGEVRVGRKELPGLMQAAESLQVRGLALSEPRLASPPVTPTTDILMGDEASSSTPERLRQESPEVDDNISENILTPLGEPYNRDHKMPHTGHINFSMRELRDSCGSPLIPRRKQARPRRRSGELVPQDLSRPHPPASLSPPVVCGLNLSNNSHYTQQYQFQQQQQQQIPSLSATFNQQEEVEVAENLSMKRSVSPLIIEQNIKTESEGTSSPRESPLTNNTIQTEGGSLADIKPSLSLSALSLTPPHHQSEYLTSLGQLAAHWLPNHSQNHLSHKHHHTRENSSPLNRSHLYQPREQITAALNQRRTSTVFPLDGVSPLGGASALFSHTGFERGSLIPDIHDTFKAEAFHGFFSGANLSHHTVKKTKKHRNNNGGGGGSGEGPRRWSDHSRGLPVGRPKGQHSAPRGGPPRSWTNAELTEALQHVWNKKMTTSQASRIFGIPYNSLLMYVRGKYGKSLKLEQLRRDCIGASGDMMNSLNNNVKTAVQSSQMSHSLSGIPHPTDENPFPHHSLLSAGNLPQSFFPDFSAAFPVPVSMVHLLPPSEQKTYKAPNSNSGINCGNNGSGGELNSRSRTPSPMSNQHDSVAQPSQPTTTIIQQNGSN